MSNTRVTIRKEVNRLLSGGRITSSTVTTAGAGTGLTVIDTGFKSTLLDNYPFTGDIILLTSGACVGLWRRIASFAATSGTFTVDDAFTFTADGTGVTITATTLTDARQAWTVNSFVGYVITCATRTMTVTSNTATVLTGASWAASDPSDGNAYSVVGAIAAGVTYEMFHVLHPSRIEECIDHALRKINYPCEWPISILPDSDMEESGTTDWTSTASTLAKDTTAANVFRGSQSLSITDDSTIQGRAHQGFFCVAGEGFQVWAFARNSAVGTECQLLAVDQTAGANVESADGTQTKWQLLGFPFTMPSSSEAGTIRLRVMTASGVVYWDNVQLISNRRTIYKLPSWITEESQVADSKVVLYRGGGQLASEDYNYMPEEDLPYRVLHPKVLRDGKELFLRFDGPITSGRPYLRALRPYAALTTDASTTDADLDWVVAKTMFECYDLLDSPQTPSDERSLFSIEKDKWAHRATAFDSLFMPHVKGTWGLGEETLFRVD